MATHSSVLAWKIPQTEEPGGLQSLGSQRVGHYRATKQPQQLKYLRVNNDHALKHFSQKEANDKCANM